MFKALYGHYKIADDGSGSLHAQIARGEKVRRYQQIRRLNAGVIEKADVSDAAFLENAEPTSRPAAQIDDGIERPENIYDQRNDRLRCRI
jgi:hypothetical protein